MYRPTCLRSSPVIWMLHYCITFFLETIIISVFLQFYLNLSCLLRIIIASTKFRLRYLWALIGTLMQWRAETSWCPWPTPMKLFYLISRPHPLLLFNTHFVIGCSPLYRDEVNARDGTTVPFGTTPHPHFDPLCPYCIHDPLHRNTSDIKRSREKNESNQTPLLTRFATINDRPRWGRVDTVQYQ